MKLLRVASSFLVLLLFYSCNLTSDREKNVHAELDILLQKAETFKEDKALDSLYETAAKLLKSSTKKNDISHTFKATELLCYYHNKQKAFDSVHYYASNYVKLAKQEKDSSELIEGYLKFAILAKKQQKIDTALLYYNRSLALAKTISDTAMVANVYKKIGLCYKKAEVLIKAFENVNTSRNIYLKLGDTINAGMASLDMANIQKKFGNYSLARTIALDGLQYLDSTENYKQLAGLYHIASAAYKEQKRYTRAFEFNEKALKLYETNLARQQKNKGDFLTYQNTKANILREKGEYAEAIELYDELLSNSDVLKSKIRKARVIDNKGYALWLKNPANPISEALLLEALSLRNVSNNEEGLIASNLHLAEYYSEHDKNKAKTHALKAYENAKNTNARVDQLEILKRLMKLDPIHKETYFDDYLKIRNYLDDINNNNENLYGLSKYENDRLQEKNLAAAKENAKIEIDKERYQRQKYIYLGIALLILITGIYIFFILKANHNREKLLVAFQKEAEISQKIHDELANDVYNVMTELENSEHKSESVQRKLDVIYHRTRDISRELQDVDTGNAFSEELTSLLSSYNSSSVNVLLKTYNTEIWKSIQPHVKTTIYRVFQELLVNMKKHSEASLVMFAITPKNRGIVIQYTDNGKGISTNISKNGLQNTETRIRTIDGTFTFDTTSKKGCKININIPV